MNCAEIREMLPAYVREGGGSLAIRRHLSGCPDCRAELRRYEALMDGLSDLRSQVADAPTGLKATLVAISSAPSRAEAVRTHVVRNRRAYVGGAAVALAGTAGALAWWARRQHLATA